MTTRTIGPYTAGEIPLPLVVTFTDYNGDAIDLTGYTARIAIDTPGQDPAINTATITDSSAGQVTYQWTADDLTSPGIYRIELWVGNGGTTRLASITYICTVSPAVAIPDI